MTTKYCRCSLVAGPHVHVNPRDAITPHAATGSTLQCDACGLRANDRVHAAVRRAVVKPRTEDRTA